MTADWSKPPAAARDRARFAGSMLFWTAGQAAAITLIALQVRFAASWRPEGEHAALYTVAGAQLFLAIPLFARLRATQTILILLTALPFYAITMLLDSGSVVFTAKVFAVVAGWVLLNSLVSHFLPPASRNMHSALAASLLIATPVCLYLAADHG